VRPLEERPVAQRLADNQNRVPRAVEGRPHARTLGMERQRLVREDCRELRVRAHDLARRGVVVARRLPDPWRELAGLQFARAVAVFGVEEEVDHARLVEADPMPPPYVNVGSEFMRDCAHGDEDARACLPWRDGRLWLHRAASCKGIHVPKGVQRLCAQVAIGVWDVTDERKEASLQTPRLWVHALVRVPRADRLNG
jgi:hypothetical protein